MSRPLADPVFDIGRDLQRAYEEDYKQGRYDEMVETEMSLLKWIPVRERLPEKNGWYLVTIRGYETVTDVSLYSADGSEWDDVSAKQKVIAWMSLPEPYDCGAKTGGESE